MAKFNKQINVFTKGESVAAQYPLVSKKDYDLAIEQIVNAKYDHVMINYTLAGDKIFTIIIPKNSVSEFRVVHDPD